MRKYWSLALALSAFLASGTTALAQSDPLEPVNRVIFNGNNWVDRHVAEPAADAYNDAVPVQVQDGIHNVVTFVDLPVDFASDTLQGDARRAVRALGRFAVNGTLGVGGIFDPATKLGLPDDSNDCGITLGTYGAGEGPYLVIPLAGPSNLRDAAGKVACHYAQPLTYAHGAIASDARVTLGALNIADTVSHDIPRLLDIERDSVDRYTAVKSAYHQYRQRQIDGDAPANVPDLSP